MKERQEEVFFRNRLNEVGKIIDPYPEIKTDKEIDEILQNSSFFMFLLI